MKKKILALVLCLVLCLPFVLTSCFGGENFEKTISSFKQDYEASFDTYTTDTFYGDVISNSGKFFFTKETVESDIYKDVHTQQYDYYYGTYNIVSSYQDVGTKTTSTYRVYNAETGEVVYSATTTYESYSYNDYYAGYVYNSGYTSSLTGVTVAEYGEDLFIVSESYGSFSTNNTYALYDDTGYCQLSSSEAGLDYGILDNLDKEAVIFDESLYLFDAETNVLTNVKTFSENSVRSFVEDLYQAGDKYVLVDDEEVYVFDSEFKQLYGTTFTKFAQSKFSTDLEVFVLNNGDILVQITSDLGAYADLHDAKYDYIVDGECYTIETFIYSVEDGSYDDISCSYYISEVVTKDEAEEYGYAGLPGDAENFASVALIEDEGIVYVDNNEYVNATLSNKGDIEVLSFELGDFAQAINDDRFIVQGEYYTRVYDKNSTLIGELGEVEYFNKNFIVTEEGIYDMNLTKVVTLDEDTAYYDMTDDSMFYKEVGVDSTAYYIVKMDDYNYATTSHLVTSTSGSYGSYYTTASVNVYDRYFYITQTSYSYDYYNSSYISSRSISIYETDSYQLTSYSLPTDSYSTTNSYYTVSNCEDYTIIAVETGSVNYFVTLKTSAQTSTDSNK